jgi:hypothetical protein
MRRRVFVIAGEYSDHPRRLSPERRGREFLAEHNAYPEDTAENARLFFRQPRSADDWARDFGLAEPVGLTDLLASAGHRSLCGLHTLLGAHDYAATRNLVDGLIVTAMPGLDPMEKVNVGLVPQRLRGVLDLASSCRSQFLVGTSDAGAWAFAEAVRAARTSERAVTLLVLAGQTIPGGYASQYQIRSVLGERDQARGLDMLAAGDLWMDILRRSHRLSRAAIEELLAESSRRKHRAADLYPAAIRHGVVPARRRRITPYFDEADVAPPCCGAAAVLLTSDEDLVERVRAGRGGRYGRPPAVEVLGVGEGSSNPNFLDRRSPLVMTPAIRQALSAAAEDAGLTAAAYPACAFGILHDAFPSIELAFLLSLGLDWEEAAHRMRRYWANPYGGLLTFGHALGASGLVQVCKTFHVFTGDRRHLARASGPAAPPEGPHLPAGGATSFTTSVGGPLSHIVVALFHGGASGAEVRPPARDDAAAATALGRWQELRRELRATNADHLRTLDAAVGRQHGDRGHLLEGTTQVSVRSCLLALREVDIERLTLEEALHCVRPERRDEARADLKETIRAMQALARAGSQMFEVFDAYHDALSDHVQRWRAESWLEEAAALRPDRELAEEMKAALNVPVAVVMSSSDRGVVRSVHVLPLPDALDTATLEGAVVLCGDEDGERLRPLAREEAEALLPPWYAPRAVPPPGPTQLLEAPAVCCEARLLCKPQDVGFAAEVLSQASERARGWLTGFEVRFARQGDALSVLCYEPGTLPGHLAARVLAVARFARDVAGRCARAGVPIAAIVALGEGALFRGPGGGSWVTSRASWRAARAVEEEPRPGIALDLSGSGDEALMAGVREEIGTWGPVASLERIELLG